MWLDGLQLTGEVSLGAWIAPRLTGGFGVVSGVVPNGYQAYARICHPARADSGEPVSWSRVAIQSGNTAHALMQWRAIVTPSGSAGAAESTWTGTHPPAGSLPVGVLGHLCGMLCAYTGTPEDAFFCIWDGYGQVTGVTTTAELRGMGDSSAGSITPRFGEDAMRVPRVRLPARDYLITVGSLRSVAESLSEAERDWSDSDPPLWQSPNVLWPADRSWFVGTEVDLDSTIVGGSEDLVRVITADPLFEAWQVGPLDSLRVDGDKINSFL